MVARVTQDDMSVPSLPASAVAASPEDFVSFPTLPDPEVVSEHHFSAILSKTLRKVTNNASNLVHGILPVAAGADANTEAIDSLSLISPNRTVADESIDRALSISHEGVSKDVSLVKTGIMPLPAAAKSEVGLDRTSVLILPPSIPEILPRVTSDHHSLRLSTMTNKHALSLIDTRGVTITKDPFPNKTEDVELLKAAEKTVLSDPKKLPLATAAAKMPTLAKKTLQSRISSIFNNLPNDIELSDDLASDMDTIDNDTIDILFRGTSLKKLAESAPLALSKVGNKSPSPSKIAKLPPRKSSAHFPTGILDGAKHIITNNLGGVANSASSIIGSIPSKKKKRVKPNTSSNNPLKNGGIPKKYWMNDSFVSECLNCFKSFSAFRRKHHCRFCGQIFCSDCTIFISYRQYKDQRLKDLPSKDLQAYSDKLRVCKPCYSDVIVYLSDDSLSSSESDAELDIVPEVSFGEDAGSLLFNDHEAPSSATTSEHPLSRLRSQSMNSRRNSAIYDLSMTIANRTFKHDRMDRSELDHLSSLMSASPSGLDATQRSPEGLSRRFPTQMAIPTTRTGEAVEIPAPKKSFSYLTPLQSHSSAVTSSTNLYSGSINEKDFSEPKLWFNNHKHGPLAQDIMHSGSLENLGNLYKAVVNNRYVRLPSGSDLKFGSPKQYLLEDKAKLDREEDGESENEDEQAMSLYTSLIQSDPVGSIRPHNSLASSLSRVPTLREFPTMFVDDKYNPVNSGQTDAMKRFEFKPIDSLHNATINETKQRSDLRSNERARASLRRIKDRRMHKSGRKSHGSTLKLPPIDTNYQITSTIAASTTSTPVSPTPRSLVLRLGSENNSDSGNASSTLGIQYQNEEQSGSSTPGFSSMQGHLHHFNLYHLDDSIDENRTLGRLNLDLDPQEGLTFKKQLSSHVKALMNQCWEDCDMKDPGEQKRCSNALHKAFAHIENLKIIDTLDVKQYIKIKKIYGGSIEDTHVLEGMFITKDIDSKRMQGSIKAPKIALLMFPLEYLKQKEQFISLRIVHSQQSVYISNLVSRLVSLEPDIVIVGDTVCGLALKQLEEANITVLSNVKPQVIERLSRYIKAGIFQSVNELFFKKGVLGTCDIFEIKRFIFRDTVKTYAFFTGTQKEAGFTLCLRGGDEEFLSSFKYAAESLIPAVFNARFEKGFFLDFALCVEAPPPNPGITGLALLKECLAIALEHSGDSKLLCLKSIEHFGVSNYVELFAQRILSFSPSVHFPLPVPLANVINSLQRAIEFYQFNCELQQITEEDEIEGAWLEKLHFDFNLERFTGKEDVVQILKFVSEEKLKSLLHNFSFRSRLWSNSMKYTTYQLYPIFHKSIRFLHSRVSIKNATPCYGPIVVVVDYYSDNDKPLGQFLDQLMQESSKICTECGELFLDHYKTYAHGNAKIDMIVEKISDLPHEHFKGKDERIMWSYCPVCNFSTPIKAISDETYYLSLGKFFELNFWSKNTFYHKECRHDFFKEHVKYFGFNDYVIRMEYSPIDTYEVVVPRKKLEFIAEIDIGLKLDALKRIQTSAVKFFQSISKRLNRVKVDTSEHAEAGSKKVVELKDRLVTQQQFIKTKTLSIYKSTPPTNYLSLNVIQRDMQELGVAWDKEFNEFEKNFLPSENEITKITQFHLQNFLIDKFDTELKDGAEGADKSLDDEHSSVDKASEGEKNDEIGPMQDNGADSKDWSQVGAKLRVPLTAIEDKIMQFKQSLENDQNKHMLNGKPRPETILDLNLLDNSSPQTPNKVQDLTNYFNQMTLEFQKQREKVLENKSNNFKAIPIVNSLPIVDIYDNIEDVVDSENERRSLKQHQRRPVSPFGDQNSDSKAIQQTLNKSQAQVVSLDGSKTVNSVSSDAPRRNSRVEIPQPERNSLLKSLTNFWADRSATLWDPLEYPLDSTEHTFADSDVIVREDEPSSLVAFCLSSNDYKQKILDMATNPASQAEDQGVDGLESSEQFQKKLHLFMKIERKFKKRIDAANDETTPLESIMTKTKSNHLRYRFLDGNSDMSCKIFYSEQFEAFRVACGVNDLFIQSLSRSIKWHSKGGKSGSSFLKTLDNRYIVKELSKSELESFVSIAPFYFKYIAQSSFNTLTTALAKIFGFYQVEVRNSMNGKVFKMDFLIMENLFYNRTTTRIFDLKGSMRNRHVKQTGRENEVLLDENMIEYIFESPVFVKEQLKKLLKGSLFNDTAFLSEMDVMDYSLVIGLDDSSGKLYVGIIDWLRTFTWDKKVENWVKGKSLVGKKGKDPTIVTPKQYRTRFREAMDRYILEVPDIWYEGATHD